MLGNKSLHLVEGFPRPFFFFFGTTGVPAPHAAYRADGFGQGSVVILLRYAADRVEPFPVNPPVIDEAFHGMDVR